MGSFSIVVFGYDITSIVYFIGGALFSAVISYILSTLREKKLLKLRIQVDTAENLQKLIIDNINSLRDVEIFGNEFIDINSYNDAIEKKENKELFSCFSRIANESSENIVKRFGEWHNGYDIYTNSLLSILYFIEARQMPLIKFQNFHHTIGDSYLLLIEKQQDIFNCRQKITMLLFELKPIPKDIIDDLQTALKEFRDVFFDISGYLMDLQIGLQNEFYKRIFRTKIPIRKPKDPSLKALTPKKNRGTFIS